MTVVVCFPFSAGLVLGGERLFARTPFQSAGWKSVFPVHWTGLCFNACFLTQNHFEGAFEDPQWRKASSL